MPKVLRIINRFNLGGPTYNAAYLTRYLAPEFETMLIGGAPSPGEAHSGFILDQLGVAYFELPEMSRSINPIKDIQAFLKIRKIIREFKPDIVHTHAAKAGALGRIAARLEGVPVIVHTYHGHVFSGYFGKWKSKLVQFIERTLGKISTAIVVISKKQQDEIANTFCIAPLEKTHCIPLGFDLKRFQIDQSEKRKVFRNKYKLEELEVAIGIIGRFAPVKNHPLFFASLRKLQDRTKNWKAFVIGDGPRKEEMIASLSDLGASEEPNAKSQVIFTSWIKNIDEALAGLDIVVLTSINEGTPVSLIEAQAAGRPVVSTNVGGASDCILHLKSGYIVESNADTISDALYSLVTNQAEREAMGKTGQAFVLQQYNFERLVKDVGQLYRQLLSNKRGQ